jgi:hypothetical protein
MSPGSILADDRNSAANTAWTSLFDWRNLMVHPHCQFYVSEVGGWQGGEIYGRVGMGLNLCVNTTEINVLIIKLQAASKTFEQFV